MTTLYYNIDATGIPILDTVTNQVIMGFLDEVDLTRRFKDALYIISPFKSYSQYDDGNGSITLNKNRCDVTVNYILDKSQVPWPVETPYTTTAYGVRSDHSGHHTPILIDTDAGILIEHYTTATAIDMTFTMNFQTYDDAVRAFDVIQSKYKGSLVQTPYDISFSYPITMSMFKYLAAVYEAKQNYKTKTLLDYINDKKISEISFDVRKSQLTNPNADVALMVRVQNLQCLAQVTMDQKEPEDIRVQQLPDSFKITLSMQFQFGRPTLVAIHTPVSVDNTLLPYELFLNLKNTHHWTPEASGVYQDVLMTDFMKRNYGDYSRSAQIIRLPEYDTWYHQDQAYTYYEYRPFLIGHFTLDGSVTTIDLKRMDDITLHPIVQSILKETKEIIFNYGGIFHIGVYAGNLLLDPSLVSLSDDLILTIESDRPDKVYHFVLSETTNLQMTSATWDHLLIRYRYFFPMTIERNIERLVRDRYFYIDYDDSLLNLISRLNAQGLLQEILKTMIDLGEDTQELFAYTQTPVQLADYLVYTESKRKNYTLPKTVPTIPTSPTIPIVAQYYEELASTDGRSLFVAFIEQCLILGYISLTEVPVQYLRPNKSIYPYANLTGGSYGFNTPLRILRFNIRT